MNLDFSNMRLTVVVAPVDMRSGFRRLSFLASTVLDIDVESGGELVVFVSRDRGIVKAIWSDQRGNVLLSRRLHAGRFERLLGKISGAAVQSVTAEELMKFLDGERLMVPRTELFA